MNPGLIKNRFRTLLLTVVVSGSSVVVAAGESGTAVRLHGDAARRAEAASVNPELSLDYGSFAWWRISPEDLDLLTDSGIPHQPIPDAYRITLGEQTFDPLIEVPDLPPGWGARAHTGSDLHLIQAHGPLREAWPAELRNSGLEPVQYIHPFTYVVWGTSSQVALVSARSWIRWSGPFAPGYRVLPRWRHHDTPTIAVNLLVVSHAGVSTVTDALVDLGATAVETANLDPTWTAATAVLPSDRLADAAAIPGVFTIQPQPNDGGARGEMSNQVNAGNVAGDNSAFPGYSLWLDGVGVDGDGVVMANVDQGADQDHPDLAGRFLPCSGDTCGGAASSSHGTHTSGIQSATGASGVSSGGFLRGLGMAPGAQLVEQLYYPFYTQPGGMSLLIRESEVNGAVLSSNSWGPSGSPRGYDSDTKQTDMGVRDADPETPGNQPLTYVLSFMNGYGGTSSQGTPDEAKNLITVGSTKMQNSDGSQILEIDDLSSNSAHGPALDGRTIPHIVAPGCRVDSTIPPGYGLSCGTSMSSPHVSGTAALLIEQWRSAHGVDPSPAMIKAELLVTARGLAGNLDADGGVLGHPFDSKQGWGRMDTGSLIDPSESRAVFDAPELLTTTGDEWGTTLPVDDDTAPVRVMLVWTDAPGHGLGGSSPAWNNDLDLVVEADGVQFPGNLFDPDGWSSAGAIFDWMNNTEGVFLPPGTAEEITITVRAANLNSDGVPGNSTFTDQDFAVVVANAIPAGCTPGTIFNGDLDVTELTIDGVQVFRLEWLPATPRCGGTVSYVVDDMRGGEPGVPVATTGATSIDILGASPGIEYCFGIDSFEDRAPGEGSGTGCATGTAARIAGDLDCDAAVGASDLLEAVAVVFGAPEPECAGFPAADATLDGVVDAADGAQIVRSAHDPL
jgi:subtilisin family serine protease